MKRWQLALALVLACSFLGAAARKPAAPIAARRQHSQTVHGVTLEDPWAWLADREDPQLAKVLKAEVKYATACLKDSKALAQELFKEYKARIPALEESPHALSNGYYYYNRQSMRQEHSVYYRRQNVANAPEELLMDVNKLAKGKRYFDLDIFSISPDNQLLAYSTDESGAEVYRLWIKDLKTGKTRDLKLDYISDFVWQADSRHALVILDNEIMRSNRCYRLDTSTGELQLLYTEEDPAFNLGLYKWGDRERIFLSAGSKNDSEVWQIAWDDLSGSFRPIAGRQPNLKYSATIHNGDMYFYTNRWNPDYSIGWCPLDTCGYEGWQELIPSPQSYSLQDFTLFTDHIVVNYMYAGHNQLAIYDRHDARLLHEIIPAEPSDLGLWNNPDPSAPNFNYYLESWLRPYQIFSHSFATHADSLYYSAVSPTGYDPENYVSTSISYPAPDGTLIPLTLIHKKDLPPAPNPLWLNGYGAYGDVESPWFSRSRQSILDRGVIWAMAHVRGGGEMGQAWHDGGRMLNKKNSFMDFTAAVEYLISQGITAPDRILIEGGSAGGLLMGAVTNLIPTRVKAVIADVPFVDVINTMLDEELPLTVGEYKEWGNPANPDEFHYMLSYSPYDNVRPAVYPQMLISSGWMDYRVGYWEGLKWAQKLRANNLGNSQIIYLLQKDEGHTGSAQRLQVFRNLAQSVAWGLYWIIPGRDK